MPHATRRKLFYLLALVFVLLGAFVLLYAEGWRWDFQKFVPEKVGAIFIRSYPPEANFYLNGQPVSKDFNLIGSGTFVNSLLPGNYNLDITLPEYHSIHRTITVEPSLVSEAKYAVLAPESSKAVETAGGPFLKFWLVNQNFIFETTSGTLKFGNQKLPGADVVGWTDDFQYALTTDAKKNLYYWNDLVNGTSTNLETMFRRAGYDPSKVILDSQNDTLVLGLPSGIAAFNPQRGTFAPLPLGTTTPDQIAIIQPWLAWNTYSKARNISYISVFDRSAGALRTSKIPVPERTVKLAWTRDNRLGILQSNGAFYIYDLNTNQLLPMASDARDFTFSDDNALVAVLEHKGVEVFGLRNQVPKYWRFGLSDADNLRDLFWYRDRHHLFLNYPDRIMFLDLDDAHKEYLADVAKTPQSFYEARTNALYYLENGTLNLLNFPG